MGTLRIGTSGYAYDHWRGVLYPPELPRSRWLVRYAEVFDTVELNNTFYRLPSPGAVARWREGVPLGFRFACKGSRYLTHSKLLLDAEAGIARFVSTVEGLGARLGPILWQLPPRLERPDERRLAGFLARLPRTLRHVVEFRAPGWYCATVCDVLDAFGAAFCEHDLVAARLPRATGGFRYLRFHGASASRYSGSYGTERLRRVADDITHTLDDAYVYFNNDVGGAAVRDALALRACCDHTHSLGRHG